MIDLFNLDIVKKNNKLNETTKLKPLSYQNI